MDSDDVSGTTVVDVLEVDVLLLDVLLLDVLDDDVVAGVLLAL